MFTGLSAFPLTPLHEDRVDEVSLGGLVRRAATAGVGSITVLGSTGGYAYLDVDERARAVEVAVENAGDVPVFMGVGALRTSRVIASIRVAERAGAAAVLLAPMTYLPLTDEDVFQLFRAVTESTDLPVILYDNPSTTRFSFSLDLYRRIAELPGIASIKIPGVPTGADAARAHVAAIRAVIPTHVTIGISGDAFAAEGLAAGCDAWYSVIGGIIPATAVALARAFREGRAADGGAIAERLTPLWTLFAEHGGSLRVVAAIAEHRGLVRPGPLPLPIQGLDADERARVIDVFESLEI